MIWHFLRYGRFAHDLHRGRDKDGRSIDVCVLCHFTRFVLAEDVIIGPAHHQRKDFGAIQTKAKRKRDNVTEFPERLSQR